MSDTTTTELTHSKYAEKPFNIDGMPPGIPFIVGNEAAERFSFYGMKAILTVFMTEHLLGSNGELAVMSDADAKFWVHTFVVAAYFFPLVGAIISDWLFGKYITILWISIVYCIGHACLALDETRMGLAMGLAFISIGTGAIKPCVSAHVGDQFGRRNKHLLSKVFGWFYVAINTGAFISTLLTPVLLDRVGPSLAFGVPGILMAIATIIFWSGRHKFVHVPPRGREFFEESFSGEGLRAIMRLLPIYAFVAMFWCLFDQTASAWVLQAKNMDLQITVGSREITLLPSQIQAVNPGFILLFVPIFSYVIYPALDKTIGLSPLRKVAIGMFLTVVAFSVSGWIETQIEAGGTPTIWWQILAYAILTAAEVMVSITCLEFSYTQAPNSMKSVIMSLYLLSVAAGNEFTAVVNAFIEREDGTSRLPGAQYYWFFTACMFVAAVGFLFIVKSYKGKTYIQDDTPTVEELDMEADAEGTEH